MSDLYKTLGLKKDASQSEIKKAYRALALEHHPDRNPDSPESEEKFKEISSAYDVLGNKDKKIEYDTYGSIGNNSGFNPFSGGAGGFDISDLFNFSFGGQRRTRGQDIRKRITISFMDAALGCSKDIEVSYNLTCEECSGKGGKKENLDSCSKCNGEGRVGSIAGNMRFFSECPICIGKGYTIKIKCVKCNAYGSYPKKDKLKVSIPEGIDTGTSIRLKEKGLPGETGNGDLYLQIIVTQHKIFARHGFDIYSVHKIDYIDAALGISIDIETISGKVSLKIPERTQPNSILKISKKGIKGLGAHLAKIEVYIPNKISKYESDMLKKIKEKR